MSSIPVWILMLLVTGGEPPENAWQAKAKAAVARAEKQGTDAAYSAALDATWRADDWAAAARIADRVLAAHPQDVALQALAARALWRAGRLREAEQLAARWSADTRDHVALRVQIDQALSRGERTRALEIAARLEPLTPRSAEDAVAVFSARLAAGKLTGVADLLKEAERKLDPQDGYPQTYLAESIEGVGAFLAQVGDEPLNIIAAGGAAPMPPLVMLNLPSCEVLINGRGPYRMVVDTGGSIMLALDTEVARELGVKSLATAAVRGVSGKQETGQALIDDLRIGTIRCRRVVTRVFDVRGAIMNAADGIIGTGIFADGRMTLDFVAGQLRVSPTSSNAGAGEALDVRLIGDAKIIVPVQLREHAGLALLDTGADAVALATSRMEQLFPDRPVRKLNTGMAIGIGGGQTPEIALGTGVKMVIGQRTFPDYGGLGLDVLDTTLSPALGLRVDILLGMPFFRDMRTFTIDFGANKMWIEWLRPEEPGQDGVAASQPARHRKPAIRDDAGEVK
jgi:hypothetical protein